MLGSQTEAIRKLGLASLAALLLITTLGGSAALAAPPQVEYTVNQTIVCRDVASFCPGVTFVLTVSATAFWNGKYIDTVVTRIYQGHTLLSTTTENDHGPWTIGADNNFVISGTNTTTVASNGHSTTTTKHFSNFDTHATSTPGVYKCAQVIGTTCPKGLTADLVIAFYPKTTGS
jgi:hypothetical protein